MTKAPPLCFRSQPQPAWPQPHGLESSAGTAFAQNSLQNGTPLVDSSASMHLQGLWAHFWSAMDSTSFPQGCTEPTLANPAGAQQRPPGALQPPRRLTGAQPVMVLKQRRYHWQTDN